MEYKTPRAEVELGTCISPPSTPACCPLSCLPLCFLSHSFYTISPPHSSFDCSFPWAYTLTHTNTTHAYTHKTSKTHFLHTVQRELHQLSFDSERKVASTTNNDRHSRNKPSKAITPNTPNTHTSKQAKCKIHKKTCQKHPEKAGLITDTHKKPPTHTHTCVHTPAHYAV